MKGALQEAEQVRCRPAGEQGFRSACLDGRHIAGLQARRGMPNPENPAMNADQGAGLDPLEELRLTDPGLKHLLARHYAVGPPSQLGENSLDCPAFGRHWRP